MDSLSKDYPLWMCRRRSVEFLGEFGFLTKQNAERLLILVPILNILTRYATLYSSTCHCRADLSDESRVDGLGDEIVAAKGQIVDLIDIVHHIRHRLLGEVCNGMDSSQFHLFVNGTGMHVEGTTEDVWETDDIIDLVRIVGTPGRHQYIGASLHSVLVGDLRHRVGQSEDDRTGSHRAYHILREHIALRESYKDVGTVHSLGQRMDISAVGSEETLLFVQVLTIDGDDPLGVEHNDILLAGTDSHIELRTRDGGSTSTVDHNLNLRNILADDFHGILQSGGRDDGCSVLVVVHHRNIERTLQTLLNIETLRGLDVFKVNTAKGWSNAFYGLAELLGVFLVNLDVEHVSYPP